ncbi:MAG: DUF2784 domain-containing protein [Gemmatimonadetes bacterium]|nr:DUF2784 domain-containing protein [Gemmatimonadota bacterium]MYE16396.1 DUF2784 domain-containing protein [Gemmatimonadota bacterium]MYG24217.1 DUF2784 domain-containing protein [Gemmatimonadota bacterium]MYJ37772.1 DUF2784 domain-containing protein [Gemmatimonadota bacterium]
MSDLALYRLQDILFVVLHTALIGFNVLGWAWRRTRRFHLVTIGATLLSWFGLGAVYGWGYCPLTDWHWRIKLMLGETDLPGSWIKYYLDRITGLDWSPMVVDWLVVGTALGALGLSVVLNLRDRRRSGASAAAS